MQFGDSITILGASPSTTDSNGVPYFVVYPGTSESIPNNTKVSIVEYPNTNKLDKECIWIFTEPPGSRVRINIIEFDTNFFALKIRSGVDPSHGEPIAVISDQSLLPLGLSADAPSVWITVEILNSRSKMNRLRIVATVYNMTGKYFAVFSASNFKLWKCRRTLCEGAFHVFMGLPRMPTLFRLPTKCVCTHT